jgi:hypothetical protein
MSGMPDTSTIDDYGGVLVDYSPVVDPTTDREALAMDQALEDCAQMTQTACRAWVRFTLASTTGGLIFLDSNAAWGNSVLPVLARVGTGIFTVTWPATVIDSLGNAHMVNLKWAQTTLESGLTFGFIQPSPITVPNQVQINVATSASSPNDYAGTNVLVRVG